MGDSRVVQSSKKMSHHKSRRNNERQPKQPKDTNIPVENGPNDDSRWQLFSDEDYIVLCLRDDGAFNVVKDGKPETSNRFNYTSTSSPRPVNRKLNYGEEAKTNDGDVMVFDQKDKEETIYFDIEASTNNIIRRYQIDHEVDDCSLVSVESSSESNQSDGSTCSFAFPVLGWEWMGSPVQMPKSEGLQLRKNKACCVGFQCFRVRKLHPL